MSREDVERTHRTYDAFNRGDVEAFLEAFDPDVEWRFNPAFIDNQGRVMRGHEGMRKYFAEDIQGVWREYRAEAEEVHDLDGILFVVLRFRASGLQSGVDVDMRMYEVYVLREGRVLRRDSFTDRDHALAALERLGVPHPRASSSRST